MKQSSISSSGVTSDNTTCGSEVKPCYICFKGRCDEKATISNGMRLVRIRFGIPKTELPDLDSSSLSSYLLFLLAKGKTGRSPLPFPRSQSRIRDKDGLCNLQRLCRRDRWNLAHSLNSIKRNLPAGCKKHTPSARTNWEKSAFSTPPPSSSRYLSYVRKEVSKMFPLGWDRSYEKFVYSHNPNATSRQCGQRADTLWSSVGQKGFLRACLGGTQNEYTFQARYKEVLSAGKNRPLVIYDAGIDLLAPYHKTLYSHLGKMPWLLQGPPTEKKISSVAQYPFNTSVDLVSATDNLSLEVTEAILGVINRKSASIPGGIKYLACQSLYPEVDGVSVTHGQMMGAYLSFPLLCLHSYLAASWSTRRCNSKVLVNGDDCLISSDQPITESDYPPGYIMNVLKTTFNSPSVAEINSTVFLAEKGGKRWREVRHLRRGGFTTDFKGMMHAASAVKGSTQWTDAFIRSRIGSKWGFLPSQLGLLNGSHSAFMREVRLKRKRNFTELPQPESSLDERLVPVSRELETDEVLALKTFLFNNGRGGKAKRDEFNPSMGLVRKSYSWRKTPPWRSLTYLSHRRGLKYKPPGRRDMHFMIEEYISYREEKAVRDLHKLVCIQTDA